MLAELLVKIGLQPTNADQQLFVWHVDVPADSAAPAVARKSAATADARKSSSRSRCLVLIVSTHVDDLKGAGEDKYRDLLIKELETKFGKLKVNKESFECIGAM
ncbi:hypothetical protein N9L68_06500 [bacterium]|nr:hypothetical protein [bacterium]